MDSICYRSLTDGDRLPEDGAQSWVGGLLFLASGACSLKALAWLGSGILGFIL